MCTTYIVRDKSLAPSRPYCICPELQRLPNTLCWVASEALRFGHGCAVHVRGDVGAGDVEVDINYITFIMSAQYTGYLVPYKDKVQPGKCTNELTCTDTGT